jgi:hypothetical protein
MNHALALLYGVLTMSVRDRNSDALHRENDGACHSGALSITVVIFCWRILLISESMGHHDSEIMDDRSID